MASDPRATHDADYYLSRHFPRDVEEAEWLYESICSLDRYLCELEERRDALLQEAMKRLETSKVIPDPDNCSSTDSFLDQLVSDLAPKLRELAALRAIRLEELELLTNFANEIPTEAQIVSELAESSRQAVSVIPDDPAADHGTADTSELHRALIARLVPRMRSLDDSLRDLAIFVPVWRQGVSQRRALLFRAPAAASIDAQDLFE
jgi:hypothetical protein